MATMSDTMIGDSSFSARLITILEVGFQIWDDGRPLIVVVVWPSEKRGTLDRRGLTRTRNYGGLLLSAMMISSGATKRTTINVGMVVSTDGGKVKEMRGVNSFVNWVARLCNQSTMNRYNYFRQVD